MQKWQRRILRKVQAIRNAEHVHLSRLLQRKREVDFIRRQFTSSDLPIPTIGSTICAFTDGCVLIRHTIPDGAPIERFEMFDVPFSRWEEFAGAHVDGGWFRIGSVCHKSNFITFQDCRFDGLHLKYLFFAAISYDENAEDLEESLFDFSATFDAVCRDIMREQGIFDDPPPPKKESLDKLKRIRRDFVECLREHGHEEKILQRFLEGHPVLLAPQASTIPKQTLGSDCVTDFVIAYPGSQGVAYAMVEIEQAAHAIFTAGDKYDFDFRAEVTHAIGQTQSWAVWLEDFKVVLQKKLPGFETPQFIVVIGRTTGLEERHLARIRQFNREQKNTTLYTYDDLLANLDGLIDQLSRLK